MAAKKKAAPAAPAENELEAAAKSETVIEPVATKAGVPTYRVDLGESLPPQKPFGVA